MESASLLDEAAIIEIDGELVMDHHASTGVVCAVDWWLEQLRRRLRAFFSCFFTPFLFLYRILVSAGGAPLRPNQPSRTSRRAGGNGQAPHTDPSAGHTHPIIPFHRGDNNNNNNNNNVSDNTEAEARALMGDLLAPEPSLYDLTDQAPSADVAATAATAAAAAASSPSSSVRLVMRDGRLFQVQQDGTVTAVREPGEEEGDGGPDGGEGMTEGSDGSRRAAVGASDLSGRIARHVLLPEEEEEAVSSSRRRHAAASDSSGSQRAARAAVARLEAERGVLTTLAELAAVVDRCQPFLPLRVGVEPLAPRGTEDGGRGSATRFVLTLSGPVGGDGAAADGSALSLLEDVLLEDCDPRRLVLAGLHAADVAFSQTGAAATGVGSGSIAVGAQSRRAAQAEEGRRRVVAFVTNILAECSPTVESLQYTRCGVDPGELGLLLPPPPALLGSVRELRFVRCGGLTGAHVEALLACLQAPAAGNGGGGGGGRGGGPLDALETLQLSGAVTTDAVAELLTFIADTADCGFPLRLTTLILPPVLRRAAQEHPLLRTHPDIRAVEAV